MKVNNKQPMSRQQQKSFVNEEPDFFGQPKDPSKTRI